MALKSGLAERCLRGRGEMAAEAEQDADGVEQGGDAHGHGAAGPVRLGIGGRGRTGCGDGGASHFF